jgi:AcrR family transcriptional regulator
VADVNSTRRYVSPLREQSARQTRQAILDAARELFIRQGYVVTTLEQIAGRAGVSRPTVFAAAGNKRAILKRLHDIALAGDDQPVPVAERSWYREALREPDPRRSLRLYARNVTRVQERYADLHQVLQMAAAADDELAELWQASEDERRTGAGYVVDALVGKGPLKPGLDRDSAVDLLWVFNASDIFRRLVRRSGWTSQRYEQWLAGTFCDQLLPAAPPRP